MLSGQSSVFKDGIKFEYKAIYEDSVNQIFITDTITLTVTDLPWKHAPKSQKMMVWEYKSDLDSLTKSNMFSIGWVDSDSTGYREDEEQIFTHPPRHNQYTYTEIAPFPIIVFPLEINKIYQRFLFVGSGFGEWDNLKLKFSYEILKNEDVLWFDTKINCWFIHSTSESDLGQSKMDFIFNTEIGFLEMNYKFYDNKRIVFQLLGYNY